MGKLFAILGDIHANLEALEVVLADCRDQGVTDYLCTGDVVGYNASPHECLEKVRALGCPIVMGNHDCYVSTEQDLNDFNPSAAEVIKWTRKQLTGEELDFLSQLPYSVTTIGITLVHSSLDKPEEFPYVFEKSPALTHFSHQITPICFHGHTHCPIVYEKVGVDDLNHIKSKDLPDGKLKLTLGRKYFINVGSVGQPRDGDPRAAYVLYDTSTREVRFRRLEYDVAGAQARIRAAELPENLAVRLEVGK